MEKDYSPYDPMRNADESARNLFEKLFGNDERVQAMTESSITNKFRVIAEGTMAPKLFYENYFTNPITGETGSYEVCCAFTRDQITETEKLNIDLLEMCKKAALQEFEHSTAQRRYDIIKEYATENNSVTVDVVSDEHIADNVWTPMKDVIESSTKAKVVFDVGLYHALNEIIKNTKGEELKQFDTTSSITASKNVILFERPVSICIYNYAPFDWMNCLVYDEENPKNCKLVTFNFVKNEDNSN